MFTLLFIITVCLMIFIFTFVSPRKGDKLQAKSKQWLSRWFRKSRNLPKAIKWPLDKQAKASHKTLDKSAELGKQARDKAPF